MKRLWWLIQSSFHSNWVGFWLGSCSNISDSWTDTSTDPTFTEWLFLEASKGAIEVDEPPQPGPSKPENSSDVAPLRDALPHATSDSSRRQSNLPRNGVYQQALSQALPSSSGHKRPASGRSPSPSHPNKARRTDLPTGPRAMLRDGPPSSSNPHSNTRSLLDRVGGPATGGMRNAGNSSNGFVHDDIQTRIDTIVNSSPDMMMANGYPGMDMSAMAGMANPLVLQEMMMNQMALMAQMASSMGMMNGGAFPGPGFPMQGIQGDMGIYQGGVNTGFQGSQQLSGNGANIGGRGRGGTRGGRGGSTRGRGGSASISAAPRTETTTAPTPISDSATAPQPIPIAAPVPTTPNSENVTSTPPTNATAAQRLPYAIPERPQSPTLCKFNIKCSNPHCRYAHPSPVATAESGVVLSNEACDKGKGCQDKDCIKGHVSPAVLNPQRTCILSSRVSRLIFGVSLVLEQAAPPSLPLTQSGAPCRFGAACTRPGCTFSHPARSAAQPSQNVHFTQQCRFGAGCTRAACAFQHPAGRVLPTAFHRGLSTTGPMVTIVTPETGSMGSAASPHRSVKFNKPSGLGLGVKEKMQQQLKEIEERKKEAERAVREAEAAAATTGGKKDEAKPVAIAA